MLLRLSAIGRMSVLLQVRWMFHGDQKATRSELVTYLEVIPPSETYRIIEGREKQTQSLLSELHGQTTITKQQEQAVEKHLMKHSRFLTVPQIKEVCRLATNIENASLSRLFRKVMNRLERHIDVLEIPDLVDIIYQLAKLNRKEPRLMKAIEDRIIEEPLKIHFPTLRKALFAYAHLNMGCTTLYSSIARTIKIGQHELEPLELAELANLFSRVQENAQGGFGTFRIAEARLEAVITTMPFDKLVEASRYLLTQNLGSNNLQAGLEQFLYKKFPPIDKDFSISKLVKLLKSVSGYQFKYNDGCLQQLLENATLKAISHMTVEQLEETLWSWARVSRGSKELWEKLEFHIMQKIGLLNPRGICFGYWAFTRAPHSMDAAMDLLETHYQKIKDNHMHYDLKMLQGMPKRHPVNQQLFVSSCKKLIDRIGQLGNQDFMTLLAVMNDSDIDYEHQQAKSIAEALHASEPKLLQMLKFYKPSQIVDILYLWVKLDIKNQPFLHRLLDQLSDLNSIPKKAFLKALFSFVMRDQYQNVFEMLKIVYLMRQFGPVGYFFPPGEYPLLAYSVFHVVVNGRSESGERLQVEPWLTSELIEYMNKLEPGILNNFELKAYNEARNLIAKWQQ